MALNIRSYAGLSYSQLKRKISYKQELLDRADTANIARRTELKAQIDALQAELDRKSDDLVDIEPIIYGSQILGGRGKVESQYDNYRFSKENPNPNWS